MYREIEIESNGILPSEIEEVGSLARHMNIDPNEWIYFLVCAKIPSYMSKIDRSLRSSFVESALSLYFIERYNLISAISKLFEVLLFWCSLP